VCARRLHIGLDPAKDFRARPLPEAGTLAELQEKILNDLSEVISHHFNKYERENP